MTKPQMDNAASERKISLLSAALRFACYLLLSTVGVAAVGIALLAQPVSQYYDDQALMQAQHGHISQLKKTLTQQGELLSHIDQPAVLERIAVNNFNYLPAESAAAEPYRLAATWPELESALDYVAPPGPSLAPDLIENTAQALAARTHHQIALAALGAALILISLTCFYRKS